MSRLDVHGLLDGRRLLVVGGTGFLGKVWLSLLLARLPEIAHIYLVVRPRKGRPGAAPLSPEEGSEARFWAEVVPSPAFDPLRAAHPGAAFEAFLREKVSPVPGDVSEPFAGLSEALRARLRGNIDALCNASGVVDFNPPLDESLKVNAFGMQNLVALARDLGDVPFLHTSTCYVAGGRTGAVEEEAPGRFPFPKADVLDPRHWSPEREIAECVDLVENVRHRANDAFRQSAFLDRARRNLDERGEPTLGSALADELARVKRRYEEDQLIAAGTERAKYWGWHNIYTYTKSIGEQILGASGLRYAIVRPAVVESAVSFPSVGWCEGINTTAPVIYLALKAPGTFPAERDSVLDVVPVDMVAAGMTLALAELLEGTHRPVYQLGTSDSNPVRTERLIELVGLYKRRHYQQRGKGNPLLNALHARLEPVPITAAKYQERGPQFLADTVMKAAGLVRKAAAGPLAPLVSPAADGLEGVAKQLGVSARILDMFLPFMATHNYRFSCAAARAAYQRLDEADRALLPWAPDSFEWRDYFLDIHCPGLERNVHPEIDEKLKKPLTPLRRYDHLLDLIDVVAERHGLAAALLYTHPDGLARLSYAALRDRVETTAARLAAAGVAPGDRVLLSGANHPDWVVAWFGVVRAGGVVVPVDPDLSADAAQRIGETAEIRLAILDDKAWRSFGAGLEAWATEDLHDLTGPAAEGDPAPPPRPALGPDSTASVLFTSGTTGTPKGVMLSHGNLASMLASLSRLFPLTSQDRVLSVLPLHHTFEFSCGLLLPLSRGTGVLYLDAVNGERLSYGLKEGRITAMVGVPALWQLLERRIRSQVRERGRLFEATLDAGLELNRLLGEKAGLDAGRIFFAPVHANLGGNIRTLISGGSALPPDTHKLFAGLGLSLAEGYGLTEASPVLTVARARPGAKPGNVGKAIPGVELRVADPDANGVGEVLARGPNVMAGYYNNPDATAAVLDADGWLHTGDLGRLDHRGRLVLVGRSKEVVVTAAGENIYLDDVESRLGTPAGLSELALVGLPDPRGGERLGLLAVPASGEEADRAQRHEAARRALRSAIEGLPAFQRPAVVHLVDAPLPRTATRKVKRREVREVLSRIVAATPAAGAQGKAGAVGAAVAAVAGVAPGTVHPGTRLKEDLGFDSLMWVELSSALGASGGGPGVDALQRCETVADVAALARSEPAQEEAPPAEQDAVRIPAALVPPLKGALTAAQRALYEVALDMRVTGAAFIPQNRPSIVISNHSSHLDMGLVKMALGPYGQQIVGLAAKDYFFEGNKWLVAYFDQLTNLKPLDRKAGFRASFEQAVQVVEQGNVVLLFPEGTRSVDGAIQPFKPLVGKLALETGTDLLPLYLEGAYDVLPKGASLPRGRKVAAHIGPPLAIADLRRLTHGQRAAEAARRVSRLAQIAVERLRDGDVLDLTRLSAAEVEVLLDPDKAPRGVEALIAELQRRFDPTRVERPVSWYFSLGPEGGPRWTVTVDRGGFQARPGRPASGSADCVIKTSEALFTRIVREGYVPDPAEFIAGTIKTSDLALLIEFSRVFGLAEVAL